MSLHFAVFLLKYRYDKYKECEKQEDHFMTQENNKVDVTVHVDKIVRNVAIAGVLIVGIIYGCNTYRKVIRWRDAE